VANHGPQQPYYAPQPGYQPPAPAPAAAAKPPKRFGWGVLVLVGIVCFLFGVGCGATTTGSSPSSNASSEPTVPALTPATGENAGGEASVAADPAPAPASNVEAGTIPPGEWLVPDEVAPGRYRSAGVDEGLVEYCQVTTHDANGDVLEWKNVGGAGESLMVVVSEKAVSVDNSGCATFTKVG
jgi:hypothetical protein